MQGGIGNQMFQIAVAYAMSRKFNYNLIFEHNEFGGCRQGNHPSNYYSNIFQHINFSKDIKHSDINVQEMSWNAYSLKKQI